MSDDGTPIGDPPEVPEADVTAAELALGLLDGDERASAMRRVLADPDFAAEVDRWRAHFGTLFTAWPEVDAPLGALARIERALTPAAPAANDNPPSAQNGLRLWQGVAALSSIAAAALLVMVAQRPSMPVAPPPVEVATEEPAKPAPVLVAAIVPVKDGVPVAAVYDPASGSLRVGAADLVDRDHSAELWVIAGDGVPRSLGLLAAATTSQRIVPTPVRRGLSAGSTLAISVEPVGGSPSGKPTGAVIATGALILI